MAKNYLTEDEMKSMELIVSAYLDLAENRARRHIPMTMEDWAKRLDIYLQADDLEVLKDAGKISAQLAKMHAETEFEKYRVVQDRLYQSDFDRYLEDGKLLVQSDLGGGEKLWEKSEKTSRYPRIRDCRMMNVTLS